MRRHRFPLASFTCTGTGSAQGRRAYVHVYTPTMVKGGRVPGLTLTLPPSPCSPNISSISSSRPCERGFPSSTIERDIHLTHRRRRCRRVGPRRIYLPSSHDGFITSSCRHRASTPCQVVYGVQAVQGQFPLSPKREKRQEVRPLTDSPCNSSVAMPRQGSPTRAQDASQRTSYAPWTRPSRGRPPESTCLLVMPR